MPSFHSRVDVRVNVEEEGAVADGGGVIARALAIAAGTEGAGRCGVIGVSNVGEWRKRSPSSIVHRTHSHAHAYAHAHRNGSGSGNRDSSGSEDEEDEEGERESALPDPDPEFEGRGRGRGGAPPPSP